MRILWGSTAVAAVIVVAIWGLSLRSQIGSFNASELIDLTEKEQQEASQKFVKVERVELTAEAAKFFFTINNPTDDILNVSDINNINLDIASQALNPIKLLDRQGKTFVRKALSKTENFGILEFPPLEAADATLVFENLFFEKHPETVFKEILELDLADLQSNQELRN